MNHIHDGLATVSQFWPNWWSFKGLWQWQCNYVGSDPFPEVYLMNTALQKLAPFQCSGHYH